MKSTTSFTIRTMLVCVGALVAATPAHAGLCKQDPKLRIDEHTLDFDGRKPVCLNLGENFVIKLKPQNDFDLNFADVEVVEKDGPGTIRKLSIDADGNMTVEVKDYPPGTEPRYKIIVKGVGELDPRVRINTNLRMLKANFGAIENDLLQVYELDLTGLMQLDQHLRDQYGTNVDEVLDTIRKSEGSQGR